MKADRLNQVDEIFQAAVDLAPEKRAAYLDEACAQDAELRREVESLIKAYEHAGSFIERPAIDVDAAVVAGRQTASLVGQSIQHYRVVRLLGVGGMGEVYLATDMKLGRQVALKLLPAFATGDDSRLRRFRQEARSASALNHPNILTIYEIAEAGDRVFIAMEYIEGVSLREQIHGPDASLQKLLKYLTQVAEGLVKAHAAGIVHRDLKPDNVKISLDGYAKILDFGLAKLVEPPTPDGEGPGEAVTAVMPHRQSLPGMVMGTPGYMSPEQAQGKELDQRSDIFSFGCILFEAATRQKPFAGESVIASLHKTVYEAPPSLSELNPAAPPDLQRIVRRCLQKDPDERYQTIKDVAIELRELCREMESGEAELHRSAAASLTGSVSRTGAGDINAQTSGRSGAGRLVTDESSAQRPTSSAEYVVGEIRRHKSGFIIVLSVMIVALAGIGLGVYKFLSHNRSVNTAPLKVTPLTSSPGVERDAAFSPDGKQIVYTWTGEKNDNFDLYLKLVGAAGDALRLTTNPAREMSPAWSPDGRYIAFLRGDHEDKGFYLITALGGAERKLSDAFGWTAQGTMSQALSYSPDGRTLAVVDKTAENEPWSIFLLSIETGEKRRLTQPPAGYNGDLYVSFAPDGKRLAFARLHAFNQGDIYTMAVAGGEPVRITSDEANIYGLAWTLDSAEIVFSSERSGGNSTLWRVPAAGGTPEPIAGAGDYVHELSIARQGNRLAYARLSQDLNIYRLELTAQPGGRRAAGTPASFISSTRMDLQAKFSPDGRKVTFVSDRGGSLEVWVCDSEGKNPVALTNFGGPHVDNPNWSPDSHFIAFTAFPGGNGDIYVVSADGGSPRRLTTDPSTETGPSWSRDGQWIYFVSNRTGRSEVWRMPAAGGAATQLTRTGGQRPVESLDGRSVYYVKGRTEPGLWQMNTEGGEETRVFEAPIDAGAAVAVTHGIYFLIRQPPTSALQSYALEFFDFATRQTTPITTLEGPRGTFVLSGLTVSPNERFVLYAQRDKIDFDLMLIENFR